MGAKANLLTDTKIRGLKCESGKQYKKVAVGGEDNLYLFIYPDMKNGAKGGKIFKYFYDRNKSETLGRYPELSLGEARERARNFERDRAQREETEKIITLEAAVDMFIKFKSKTLAKTTLSKEYLRVKNYLYPTLKDKDIRKITKKDILAPLKALNEAQGLADSVRRCKNFISRTFDYMIGLDLIEDNVADMVKSSIFTIPKEKHFSAITDESRIRDFLKAINSVSARTSAHVRNALIFAVLTGSRPGNIRAMEWSEVDFSKRTWRISFEKMKSRREHIIGLSDQAMKILEFQKYFSKGRYVFSSKDRPLSENTVNKLISNLGFKDEMTAHGVRAMFKTVCSNHSKDKDTAERCLAHAVTDRLQKAYDRSENSPEMIERKRELLQWYADYLDSIEPIKIIDVKNLY